MKGPSDRTKVLVRHLPPSITAEAFIEQINSRFGSIYSWVSFKPGKISQKHQFFARAYINFTKPEDVVEFAEFFNGHVFVNEKGTQFKAIAEYSPCQRVPKQCPKKDGREGTIIKDPEYLEFLEAISKPVENLPSAEVQLDRREAGTAKDVAIVTPLMDFIRQKRAAKIGSQRIMSNEKQIRKVSGAYGSPSSASLRRGSEKGRVSSTKYVLRDSAKGASRKDKSSYSLASKRDVQLAKSISSAAASEASEGRSGTPGSIDTGKKILLLKGKEKENSIVSGAGGMSLQQSETSKIAVSSSNFRRNQRREINGRIIKNILLNKDARRSQSSSAAYSEQQNESSNLERDKRPPRPQNYKSYVKDTNNISEEKFYRKDLREFPRDKQERRTCNKDRPDRGVWTPLCHSDGSHASNESLSTFNFQGPHKYSGRKNMANDGKETDGSFTMSEGKSLKRGGSNYSSHEKRVWIQKPSAGS